MLNQDDTSDRPMDINQLQWALRHGQKVDGLETIIRSNQPAVLPDHHSDLTMEDTRVSENASIHNAGLKEKVVNTDQDPAFHEEISKLGKCISEEIISLRNEFTMFAEEQLNQEKTWEMAELEWKSNLEELKATMQADIQQLQDNILEKFDKHFQYADEKLQYKDNVLRQEVSSLTSQLSAIEGYQNSEEDAKWREKIEERQGKLMEDVAYIQYVVEEIATCPHNIDAQQKLREKFFVREISALKKEIASVYRKCKGQDKKVLLDDEEQYSKGAVQQEIDLSNDESIQIYTRKRKRRH